MKFSRPTLVYLLLGVLWTVILQWQAVEHIRVKQYARQALINRARDISNSLGVVIRSQRRFLGIVIQPRLESALNELVQSEELRAVALLNSDGEVVTSAGEPIRLEVSEMLQAGERWEPGQVTLVNLVDFGRSNEQEGDSSRPTIVIPTSQLQQRSRITNARRPRPRQKEDKPNPRTAAASHDRTRPTTGPGSQKEDRPNRRRRRRSRFGRPPWMDEARYKEMIQKQGLHGFIIVMSTRGFESAMARDLWLRCIVGIFASLAAVGAGWAWRNTHRSAALQIRLARAKQMNDHLREMNVAAAGLAHETRNPLNLIRGSAQMISKNATAPVEVIKKARGITNEVDRVTAQLNGFINYSRPREVSLAPVAVKTVVRDIARALETDLDDNAIKLDVEGPQVTIHADEKLIRQALFNLLINAVQSVHTHGHIQVEVRQTGPGLARIEIRDDGPGVPPEARADLFRPYFTTREDGTGLGLAIVQQIVLAHGWEIVYLPNPAGGAVFRLSGIPVAETAR